MPPDAATEVIKTAAESNLSMFGLYCVTMTAIGVFLRWYIPKIHEDCERNHAEARRDYLASVDKLTTTFDKRMDEARQTNERLMLKLEELNYQLQTFSESHYPQTTAPLPSRRPRAPQPPSPPQQG